MPNPVLPSMGTLTKFREFLFDILKYQFKYSLIGINGHPYTFSTVKPKHLVKYRILHTTYEHDDGKRDIHVYIYSKHNDDLTEATFTNHFIERAKERFNCNTVEDLVLLVCSGQMYQINKDEYVMVFKKMRKHKKSPILFACHNGIYITCHKISLDNLNFRVRKKKTSIY